MNIKNRPQTPQRLLDREIHPGRRHSPESAEKLRQAIADVRAIDNSEIDLDPASDRVLLYDAKHWWEFRKKSELVEYTVRPEGEYGIQEVRLEAADPTTAFITDFKLNGCNVDKKEWVDSNEIWMSTRNGETNSKPLIHHARATGASGTRRLVNHSRESNKAERDRLVATSPLLARAGESGDSDLTDWAKSLKRKVPKAGWPAPDQKPLQGPACSLNDHRTLEQRLQNVAAEEHQRFGGQYAEETDGKSRIVKKGYPQDTRRHSKLVQRYWRTVGRNHDGRQKDKNWSHAFLNFVMKKVGLESPLRKGENAFFQDVVSRRWAYDHEVHSTSEVEPKVGNLLVHNKSQRGDLRWNPQEIDAGLELITKVGRDYIEVTSGGYEGSVTTRRLELDWNGKVKDRERYVALMDLELELDK